MKVNEPNKDGETPLYRAAANGHLDIIKWCIASGREMDLWTSGDERTDAIAGAKRTGKPEVVTLLGRLHENPNETRHAMRLEIVWYD